MAPSATLPRLAGLVITTGLAAAPVFAQAPIISEIRTDQPGIDNDEYFELAGTPAAPLTGLSYVVIGDGGTPGDSGVVEEVTDLTAIFFPGSGFLVVAESTFTIGTAGVITDLNFENADNVTHLLVSNFTGANGQDLDTDDDGVLELTPWSEIVDLVAIVVADNPPSGTNEYHYGPPLVGPDGFAVPGHVSRCGADWTVSRFPLGLDDTPGAANTCCLTVECYYATVDDTSPAGLRQTLHEVIDDHDRTPFSSDDSWEILELADEDPNDPARILDAYKNASYLKVDTARPYEREHAWPQSYGFPTDSGTSTYPRSDYHGILLADEGYNSSRQNLPYDTCSPACAEQPTESNNGQGGSGGGYPGDSNWRTGSGTTGTWEVWTGTLGGRRGDAARALFYMDVRYDGSDHLDGTPEPELMLVDDRGLLSSDPDDPQDPAFMGILSTLLEWHHQDPVDDLERDRNEVVFFFQRNRNPFIDHPEWVDCVFSAFCPIFADGFESGDTSTWSGTAP